MPKQKVRKSASKRFTLTGSGKIKRNKANHSHMLIRRSNSAKRKMRQSDLVDVSCLLYTSPSPRDRTRSRMPSSA